MGLCQLDLNGELGTFKGDFNGNNNTIYNIHINKTENGNYGCGLLGIIAGKISNLTVTGTVEGQSRIGGIVGWARANSEISNCYNLCDVYATSACAGGVVGQIDGGNNIIINCYNMGNVQVTGGGSGAGGIVGFSQEGMIVNCYNLKPVEYNNGSPSQATAGGIVGNTVNKKSTVINCYNIGKITGTKTWGSIIGGYWYNEWISTLGKCYYWDGSCDQPVGRNSKHNRRNNFMYK